MQFHEFKYDDGVAKVAFFGHGIRECHAVIRPLSGHDGFSAQLYSAVKIINVLCKDVLSQFEDISDISGKRDVKLHPVFIRWFLSDIVNQYNSVVQRFPCAASVIQQPPLDGTKLNVWVVYRSGDAGKEFSDGIWIDDEGYIWIGDRGNGGEQSVRRKSEIYTSYRMTKEYLERLDHELKRLGGSLADNCIRTWFMVRDIDINYQGVVTARNEVFSSLGLTQDTHYIASTGINGINADPYKTVSFNAIANLNLTSDRISYLRGLSHLNRTSEYGVAFERATAVDYNDRRCVYISGTASIGQQGEILYPGDVFRQTMRMLENIEVLLKEGDACWEDVAHFIVYLRDIADYTTVARIFSDRFPEVPAAIVLAPVCRPGWLVEAECMAIVGKNTRLCPQ